jgi:predicted nucleotidyltransferase
MTLNQEKTIELIKNDAKKYKFIIGIILCGSLAKNTENENSDVDIFVIVDDIEFEKRKLYKDYFVGTIFEQSNYPVYIDGKIINKDFLKRIWTEGNECIKYTFSQVKLLYSLDNEIEEIIKNIEKTNYNKKENIKKFYALMKSYKFKAGDDMENIIQIKHGIFYTVFFACRLVLAHNDIYYPCVKNMEKEIEKCINKPKNFIQNMHKLLDTYSFEELETFYITTEEYFKEYRFDDKIRKGYVIENESYWFFGERPYSEI